MKNGIEHRVIALTEDQQRAKVNQYIAYGCDESPSMHDSDHRRDVITMGICYMCGRHEV